MGRVLPVEVRELPEDLAALDVLLRDPELLWPLVERWRREVEQTARAVLTEGRPTIAMETWVRSMVPKQSRGLVDAATRWRLDLQPPGIATAALWPPR